MLGEGRDRYFILFGKGSGEFDRRGLGMFLAVYVGAFLLGGLLAPWVYFGVEQLHIRFPGNELWTYLVNKGLDDFVDRIRLLSAAGTLIWLIGYCRLWGNFGFGKTSADWKQLGLYFGGGVFSLLPIILLQWIFIGGEIQWSGGIDLVEVVLAGLLSALLIGFLEESIFRGMVFRMFYSAMNPLWAVLLSVFLFAMSHFKSVDYEGGQEVLWYSGLGIAWESFLSVFYTFSFFPFCNYFLVGFILTLVFLRTKSLMACVGLHAGWVFVLAIWKDTIQLNASDWSFYLGNEGVINGVIPIGILMLIAIALGIRRSV